MRMWTTRISWLMVAGFLAFATGCSDGSKGTAVRGEAPAVRGVTLETTVAAVVPEYFAVSGTVQAKNSAQLSARISGTVAGIHVKEGDPVRRGALLLTLNAPESTAGATAATLAVDEAGRAVEEALARKQLADVTFERYSQLYREQAATRQELDTRRAERDMARQALARARARLAQSRETAKAAVAVAGYSRVTAPLTGIVTGKSVDLGATVFPGMPLMTIEEATGYRLVVRVPESLHGKVSPRDEVRISLDGTTEEMRAAVVEIVPRVDPFTRTFTVKLAVPSDSVRSGQYGRAFLPVGEKKGILLSRSAVMERGELTSVWVVDRHNSARLRLVKTGDTHGNRVEILAGLSNGERVVVGGMEKVSEGARVE